MMVMQRTRMISQMRAFCLEYGVAIRQGAGVFKLDLPRVVEDDGNELSAPIRRLLAELFEDLRRLEGRIADVTREIRALVDRDDVARRLRTVPGIEHSVRAPYWPQSAKGISSRRHAILPPGWAWFHDSTRLAVRRRC